jgi:hypothetical protein
MNCPAPLPTAALGAAAVAAKRRRLHYCRRPAAAPGLDHSANGGGAMSHGNPTIKSPPPVNRRLPLRRKNRQIGIFILPELLTMFPNG